MPLAPSNRRATHVKIDCRFSERAPVAELSPLARLCFFEVIQHCVRQERLFIPYRHAALIADGLTVYYGYERQGQPVEANDILDELFASGVIRLVSHESQPLRIMLVRGSDWDFGYGPGESEREELY